MAITFTGSKTVTVDVSPIHTAASLTTLLAIAPENLTRAQLETIRTACDRVKGGQHPAVVIGTLFP